METWFLLFGGTSDDGAGPGVYIGRTTDKAFAKKHADNCAANPYSTGYVQIVKDTSIERSWVRTEWDKA